MVCRISSLVLLFAGLVPQVLPAQAAAEVGTPFGGVKHVGVAVQDQDRALAFYRDVLGFAVAVDEPMGPGARWIEMAIPGTPTRLLLIAGPDVAERVGAFTNIVFLSEDVTASYDMLRSRGVRFDGPPSPLPGGGMSVVFHDVDGNGFALASRDAPRDVIPGAWTGSLGDGAGGAVALTLDVTVSNDGTALSVVIRGTRFPATDVDVGATHVRFVWRPGPPVACDLARRLDGSYAGDCVDLDEGDARRMTVTPPRREPAR